MQYKFLPRRRVSIRKLNRFRGNDMQVSLHETRRRSIIRRSAADRNQEKAADNQVLEEQYIISLKIWAGSIFTTPPSCKLNLRKRQRPSAAAVRRRVEQACARHDRQLRNLDHRHTSRGGPRRHAVGKSRHTEVVRGVEVARLIVTDEICYRQVAEVVA